MPKKRLVGMLGGSIALLAGGIVITIAYNAGGVVLVIAGCFLMAITFVASREK